MAVKALTPLSALNPNAPQFVPAAFLATEDFSPQWWALIKTDAAFRDYWLREWFVSLEEEEETRGGAEDLDEFSELEEFLEMELALEEVAEEEAVAAFEPAYVELGDLVSNEEVNVVGHPANLQDLIQFQDGKGKHFDFHSRIRFDKPNKVPKWLPNVQKMNYRIQQPRA